MLKCTYKKTLFQILAYNFHPKKGSPLRKLCATKNTKRQHRTTTHRTSYSKHSTKQQQQQQLQKHTTPNCKSRLQLTFPLQM